MKHLAVVAWMGFVATICFVVPLVASSGESLRTFGLGWVRYSYTKGATPSQIDWGMLGAAFGTEDEVTSDEDWSYMRDLDLGDDMKHMFTVCEHTNKTAFVMALFAALLSFALMVETLARMFNLFSEKWESKCTPFFNFLQKRVLSFKPFKMVLGDKCDRWEVLLRKLSYVSSVLGLFCGTVLLCVFGLGCLTVSSEKSLTIQAGATEMKPLDVEKGVHHGFMSALAGTTHFIPALIMLHKAGEKPSGSSDNLAAGNKVADKEECV